MALPPMRKAKSVTKKSSVTKRKPITKGKSVTKKTLFGKKADLTKAGQHRPCSMGCLSTSVRGVACRAPRASRSVPYCKACMIKGDPSLLVKEHPKFGKTLVAARDLPRGYNAGWWGNVKGKNQMSNKAFEWALETSTTPKMYIDATPHKRSLLQFCACPGPNEATTINFSPHWDALLNVKEKKSCLLFSTLRAIPKNHHVAMMYNKDEKSTDYFFKTMGITRADVGTPTYPAIRKVQAGLASREKTEKR